MALFRRAFWLFLLAPALVFAQDSLDLQTALHMAVETSPASVALRLQDRVAAADVQIASEWSNPDFVSEFTRSQPTAFLGAGYVFSLSGKRGKRIDISKGEAGVIGFNVRTALQALRHDARVAFYALMTAQEKEEETRQSKELAAKLLEIANQRYEAGDAPYLEVLQARLEFKRRESALQIAGVETSTAALELNRLTGRAESAPPLLQGSLEDAPQGLLLQSLLQSALDHHGRLQGIRAQENAEEARLALAKAERVPDLDVEGGTELHDAEFDVGWRAALKLELPFFNRKAGEIQRSSAELERLRAEEKAAVSQVTTDVQSAFVRYQAATSEAQSYRNDILPVSSQMGDLSSEAYKAGRTGILAVLDAQRNAREVRLEYLDILMNLQTALADLELAAGEELP